MRIESLLYFIVAVDCHSMSDASKVLHISHQCISRELKSFEDEIGAQLIERSKKGIELTDNGKICYEQAKSVLKHFQSFKTIFKNDTAFSYSVAYYTGLKEIVERTQELLLLLHPDLFFTEFNLSSGRSLEFINSGQADLIVTQISKDIYSDIDTSAYNKTILYQEPLLVALHKSRYLPNTSKFDLIDLKHYPIAFFIENTNETPLYNRIAQQFGWSKISYSGNDLHKLWQKASEEGACLLATDSIKISNEFKNDFVFLPVKQDIKILTTLFTKKQLSNEAICEEFSHLLSINLKNFIEKKYSMDN